MNTGKTLVINSDSYLHTLKIAESIGRNMRGGEVLELVSDLGGGKTAFVTGVAKGIGSPDVVSSPSFTLNNVYRGSTLTLNHYDLYRLQDPGVMKYDIAEAVADPETVVAIEWADTARDVLPADRLTISIAAVSDEGRTLTFTFPSRLDYLLEGVDK